MELFHNLIFGFSVALTGQNLLYCFVGCLLGTLIGVLPGIGPLATIAMLLPLTYNVPPVAAIIMLAGIYYGAMYGGSTTSILVNLPGETASVITCLDGYQMARQGRAGAALAIAALGSFFAGTVCTIIISVFGPPLANMALEFASPEYFSLMLMGLVTATVLGHGSVLKSLAMVVMGLLLSTVGTDIFSNVDRFSFGISELLDGIPFVIIAVGVFAFGEIVSNLSNPEERVLFTSKMGSLYPTRQDLKQSVGPVMRGTALGAFLGVLPGTTPSIATFASYVLETKVAKDVSRFGKGAIEGVAGPEAANNADAQCKFIPMLTLGIPSNPVMALMIGAMIIQGIQPGPSVITEQPKLFWGIIVSMWFGNLFLVILNLPMIGMWVRIVSVPYQMLFPAILVFCSIGVFSLNNTEFDIYVMAFFAVIGYIFVKLDCEPAPMLLAFILGPMMEEYMRRALLLSRGDPMVFFTRPISAALLALGALAIIAASLPAMHKKREEAFRE